MPLHTQDVFRAGHDPFKNILALDLVMSTENSWTDDPMLLNQVSALANGNIETSRRDLQAYKTGGASGKRQVQIFLFEAAWPERNDNHPKRLLIDQPSMVYHGADMLSRRNGLCKE
jgi:hypothetical protein